MANKLTTCKSCGAEIATNAKVCPNCGAKNKKPIYKRWWFWVIVALVLISVIAGSTGEEKAKEDKVYNSSAETTAPQTYAIGDTITTDKFEIRVKSVQTQTSVGGQYSSETPAEGGIYVCVDFEYKNISTEPISTFSCPSVNLKDANGTSYDYDVGASFSYALQVDPNRKTLSDLNPGIQVSDSKVFEISKDAYSAENFVLVVNADGNNYTVRLN